MEVQEVMTRAAIYCGADRNVGWAVQSMWEIAGCGPWSTMKVCHRGFSRFAT